MKYNKFKKYELTEDELFDEEIRMAIRANNPCWLQEQLGISLEKASEICEEMRLYDKINLRNLKIIMFARDRKKLDIKIDRVTNVDLRSEDLKKEFEFFNDMMLDKNDSAVKVEGTNSEGKRVVLYYYPGSIIKDSYDIYRQMRVYNEHGDIEALQEQVVFNDGTIGANISAVAAYKYDENGNKILSLYDDEYYGGRYYEYDETGKVRYIVTEKFQRYLSMDMQDRLLNSFGVSKEEFDAMDNSSLEEQLSMFRGGIHKKVNNDERRYDDR